MKITFYCPNGHIETRTGTNVEDVIAAYIAEFNVGIDDPAWQVKTLSDLVLGQNVGIRIEPELGSY